MITDIRLQKYRSYKNDSFEFSPGVNIIVGPNASGKTNLLEAILLICRGSSYRAKDAELIGFNEDWARLDSDANSSKRVLKLEKSGLIVNKTFEIDDKTYKRLSLDKKIPSVLFEPDHLRLLSGSPENRRDFIDDLLEQITPGYGSIRRQYKRTLAQRNALLKRGGQETHKDIFAWNVRLSELGGKIAQARRQLIEDLNESTSVIYNDLSRTNAKVECIYQSACGSGQYESSLLKHLEANISQEIERGFTMFGPHRDDINVLLNEHSAQETASRGETRTLIMMLKVCELRLIEKARGTTPILLLDDVFSELDGSRRQALTTHLNPYQTFITTTDADIVVQHFMDSCKIIPLSKDG